MLRRLAVASAAYLAIGLSHAYRTPSAITVRMVDDGAWIRHLADRPGAGLLAITAAPRLRWISPPFHRDLHDTARVHADPDAVVPLLRRAFPPDMSLDAGTTISWSDLVAFRGLPSDGIVIYRPPRLTFARVLTWPLE